nr:class I SAM-dependent methyltransferase [Nonomuraea basaltis]
MNYSRPPWPNPPPSDRDGGRLRRRRRPLRRLRPKLARPRATGSRDTRRVRRTRAGRRTPAVAEAGCGPGYMTAHLRNLGLDAFGIDLSPALIDIARKDHPDLRFEVGSMGAFDVADGELGGLLSWYSVIHIQPPELPPYFAEFRRVLASGGYLLLGFFESEGGPVLQFDHRVAPANRWPIDDLADLARKEEFVEVARMLREPLEDERFRRGHLLMRRQAAAMC